MYDNQNPNGYWEPTRVKVKIEIEVEVHEPTDTVMYWKAPTRDQIEAAVAALYKKNAGETQ